MDFTIYKPAHMKINHTLNREMAKITFIGSLVMAIGIFFKDLVVRMLICLHMDSIRAQDSI